MHIYLLNTMDAGIRYAIHAEIKVYFPIYAEHDREVKSAEIIR